MRNHWVWAYMCVGSSQTRHVGILYVYVCLKYSTQCITTSRLHYRIKYSKTIATNSNESYCYFQCKQASKDIPLMPREGHATVSITTALLWCAAKTQWLQELCNAMMYNFLQEYAAHVLWYTYDSTNHVMTSIGFVLKCFCCALTF